MRRSKGLQDHGYTWIIAWGRYLGSTEEYIQRQCDRAREHGVPTTVTCFTDKASGDRSHGREPAYKDDPTVVTVEQGYWSTIDGVTNPETRATLEKLVE